MNAAYDKWFDGALNNMVNEDAPIPKYNTFHLMYWKQYDIEIPPPRVFKPRKPKEKKKKAKAKKAGTP